ncbi:Spy/CpxP family protein refolding chaperone [Hyphomicrobium sp. DMF-1]|uniref:Spy/CpxP family protein refolding chaperone n=1 Tax=Hyphomicrobium sp. DMF-1 TaxID=3019544 RepID=UPI0022EBB6A1|nr:Spy/CpxP family protein refolding chaperone [Hyphomicrobium sp. DMF-1]WBT38021.1 Spy/CpxP family protein refolding chaperone [Hyphomicrobium sp. DMF-1]
MTMRKWVIAAALLAATATGSLAQGQQQGQHMPMGQGMGMMGGCPMMGGNMGMGMMGPGMQGMMGPGMQGMMGNMPMGMGMMGQGMGPGMMMGMGSMMEGRLAYLKAELGITDTQAAAWDGYVSAVKARGNTMQSMHATMMQAMQTGSASERMQAHMQAMQSMVESMKALLPATDALYKVLSDDQKKKADLLLGSGCCMM